MFVSCPNYILCRTLAIWCLFVSQFGVTCHKNLFVFCSLSQTCIFVDVDNGLSYWIRSIRTFLTWELLFNLLRKCELVEWVKNIPPTYQIQQEQELTLCCIKPPYTHETCPIVTSPIFNIFSWIFFFNLQVCYCWGAIYWFGLCCVKGSGWIFKVDGDCCAEYPYWPKIVPL